MLLATHIVFVTTTLSVALLLVAGVQQAGRALQEPPTTTRRWALTTVVLLGVWLLATGLLAASGRLANWATLPPPLMVLLVGTMLLTITLAFAPFGTRLNAGLPVAALVGYQAFRIPVEIVLALLHWQAVVPVQMTLEGRNWDIVSGVGAIGVALLAAKGRLPGWALLLWNIVSLALLLNIVVVSLLSTPLPLRVFRNEPANTFIATLPYVWLPTLLVPAALFGHLLIFRVLLQQRAQATTSATRCGFDK
jgi:hypothetical protein